MSRSEAAAFLRAIHEAKQEAAAAERARRAAIRAGRVAAPHPEHVRVSVLFEAR